jgi:hypothetical protein
VGMRTLQEPGRRGQARQEKERGEDDFFIIHNFKIKGGIAGND